MKVSIVCVCYNAVETIAATIETVRRQTYAPLEFVVVDGGSGDGTVDVLRQNEDIIDRWTSEPDEGIYHAMNKGLLMATGDVVGFLNADDMLAGQNVVASVMQRLQKDGLDFAFGNVAIYDQTMQRLKRYYNGRWYHPELLRFGHMPAHPGAFASRQRLIDIGGFDSSYRLCGDFELVLRLFASPGLSYAHVPITVVKMRHGGVSQRGWQSTVEINREMFRACRSNGVWTSPLLLWSRYFLKSFQLLARWNPKRVGLFV